MSVEKYIFELNGYLKALQALNGPRYQFGSRAHHFEGNAELYINEIMKKGTIVNYSATNYEEIGQRILKFSLNGMMSKSRVSNEKELHYYTSEILENINEYYGLASTASGQKEILHPLITGPVFSIELKGKELGSYFCFIVGIGEYVVQTFMARKPN